MASIAVPPAEPSGSLDRVCVRCRTHFPPAATTTNAIEHCPNDGGVLVLARDMIDAEGDPLLGTTIANRFTVVSRLGAGSMGTVYRARQEAMGREVALKILKSERADDGRAKARFEREARANSLLVSPHTVTVFDFGQAEDGSLFLAMELLVGEPLGQRLRRIGKLSVGESLRIARDALTSLSEAHRKGIIHRDIKPDNLFLARVPTAQGLVESCKVLDFGIAKVVRGERNVDALETQAGTVFGTPRYMSPEQAQGKSLDPRSDLYSLGVILFQMLAGRPPFEDEDAVVVMARHIKSPPPGLAEIITDGSIPPTLAEVVRRSLGKSPDERPSSAEEFLALLDESVANLPDVSGERRAVVAGPGDVAPVAYAAAATASPVMVMTGAVVVGVIAVAVAAFVRSSRTPMVVGSPVAAADPPALVQPVATAGPSASAVVISLDDPIPDPGPNSVPNTPKRPISLDDLPSPDGSKKHPTMATPPPKSSAKAAPPASPDTPKYGKFD